jgi:hypothetical protein
LLKNSYGKEWWWLDWEGTGIDSRKKRELFLGLAPRVIKKFFTEKMDLLTSNDSFSLYLSSILLTIFILYAMLSTFIKD